MQKQEFSEGGVLSAERKMRILELLKQEGKVVAAELSGRFRVSEDTIRRDLRELAEEGLIHRVHGGALPRTPTSPSISVREKESAPAKLAIARATVEHLQTDQVVIIDGGTTPLRVAEQIPVQMRLTVVTHSPRVALALASHPHVEVVLIGGTLFKDSLVTIGAATVTAYRQIRADVSILGVGSIDPEAGIGVLGIEEAEVKRAIVEGATKVIAVSSAEKVGTGAPFIVGPISIATHLVTDDSADEQVLAECEAKGLEVIKVGVKN